MSDDSSDLTGSLVDAGLMVHRTLGPGLLERVYEHCLAHEIKRRGLSLRRQVWLPIQYGGVELAEGFRMDLVVEERIIVEVKAVESLTRLHQSQLLSYLRLSGLRVGLLMNFNVPLFKDGVRRLAL